MSDIIIRGEGLGKQYRRGLGEAQETLRDTLTRVFARRLRRCGDRRKNLSGHSAMSI